MIRPHEVVGSSISRRDPVGPLKLHHSSEDPNAAGDLGIASRHDPNVYGSVILRIKARQCCPSNIGLATGFETYRKRGFRSRSTLTEHLEEINHQFMRGMTEAVRFHGRKVICLPQLSGSTEIEARGLLCNYSQPIRDAPRMDDESILKCFFTN
jgi:hypothetical protein